MLYNLNLQFFSTKFSNKFSTVCTLCVRSCTYCGRDKTRLDYPHVRLAAQGTACRGRLRLGRRCCKRMTGTTRLLIDQSLETLATSAASCSALHQHHAAPLASWSGRSSRWSTSWPPSQSFPSRCPWMAGCPSGTQPRTT